MQMYIEEYTFYNNPIEMKQTKKTLKTRTKTTYFLQHTGKYQLFLK